MYQSSSGTVLVEQVDAILRIRLNRPERLNACNYELMTAAMKIIQQAWEDFEIRAVTLEGTGPAFCSGEDLEEMGD